MTKKVQPALIGIFFILSCALFAIAIFIFGGNRFFDTKNTVVAYFDDSLQGLSVGAPVTYRGITIGQVKSINIHINQGKGTNHKITIPVLISLVSGDSIVIDNTQNGWKVTPDEFLEAMCRQGLRAKLKMQSVVTGKQYIDLAVYEDNIPIYHEKDGEYFEIPTIPSEMYQIQQVMENANFADLYKKITHTLDNIETLTASLAGSLTREEVDRLLGDVSGAAGSLNVLLTDLQSRTGPLFEKIDTSLSDINKLTGNANHAVNAFDEKLDPIMTTLSTSLEELDTTLRSANSVLGRAEDAIAPNSPLYFSFTEAMQQLGATAESIKTLSDFLYRNPNSLILGLQINGEKEHE